MDELIEMINRLPNTNEYNSISDFKNIKEEMEKNNLDTYEVEDFINKLNEKIEKFTNELLNKLNSLSEDQVKSIDILNKNNINWELKSDWSYEKQGYIYQVVVNSKEGDK